jgi:NAD(P)-dependent dehydrogenase (short-subunit alcohol dehydrogenase family)
VTVSQHEVVASPASGSTTVGVPARSERLALVTGAYGDIGRHPVVGRARAGQVVIAAGRDSAKLDDLARSVAALVPGAHVETVVLDLADLGSVRRAAETILAAARPLDVLVNNAAVMPGGRRQSTVDGFELAFGTNHLGHYALTGHLLPALLSSSEARVISVCAGASNQRLDTDDLNSESRYRGGMGTYMASKLASAVFSQELARRLDGTTVKSLLVSPGVAVTGVQRNNPFIGWLARYVFAPVASTPEQAARPSLYATTHSGLDNGALIAPGGAGGMRGAPALRSVPEAIASPAVGLRLWEASERLSGVHYAFDRLGAPEGEPPSDGDASSTSRSPRPTNREETER